MVHALHRAATLVRPHGFVLDLHPTAYVATVFVGDAAAGPVDAGDAPERHRLATEAVEAVIADGTFTAREAFEFDYSAWADTLDELQEHILEDWNDARIGDETMARARALLQSDPHARIRVRERVRITRLEGTGG